MGAVSPKPIVVLASTFYTASLEQPFAQALAKRNDTRTLFCVPYNQLHTFLLDPRSLIPEKTPATVILLLRVEDLIRAELVERAKNVEASAESCLRIFRERTADLMDIFDRISGLRLTLLVCPSGRGAYDVGFLGNAVRVAEHRSAAELRLQQMHRVVLWPDFERGVDIASVFNVAGDRLGHVPYSPDGLDALAEFFAGQLGTLPVTVLRARRADRDNVALKQFLGSLGVEVSVAPLIPEDEEEAMNLIRHTTHFINTPDHKWSTGELRALVANLEAGEIWTIRVRDRFGDYGLSGVMTLSLDAQTLRTGFWFLSCPVLGKQVEYAVMNWMAEIAQRRHATIIEIPFVKGKDNQVLYTFLVRLTHQGLRAGTVVPPLGAKETFRLSVPGLKSISLGNAANATAVEAIFSTMGTADVPPSGSALSA